MKRIIIHVDMDAFFASVEIRDNPQLAGKPLIIGALPSERGVVSTCSYEARKYGVHSAMSIKEAYRRCPGGLYMHPSMAKYKEASQQVHEIWNTYTDIVEYISLDEGYLDVTASAHLFGGFQQIGREIKRRVKEEVGLTCSVGIGYNMMTAKIASEEKKPDGYFELTTVRALRDLIWNRKTGVLLGIGKKTEEVLRRSGIYTVRDIDQNRRKVIDLLGNQGKAILELVDGTDNRPVTPWADPKSIGKEHTFQQDTTDFDFLKDNLRLIARELSYEIHQKGIFACTITLKITYSNMQSITRSKTGEATNWAAEIYKTASALLDVIERRPVRLIGISLGSLTKTGERQLSLTEMNHFEQKEKMDAVAFQLQKKFGKHTIKTGNELNAEMRIKGPQESRHESDH